MKNRFNLSDVVAAVKELKPLEGMRVNNIYDIDNKTYLIKLHSKEEKAVILFESGLRIHKTFTDWPKSTTPSSFTMKLRKHVKQKRIREVRQLGNDRVVVITFGEDERTNYLIIELYDRGNVILTDDQHMILNILRPRTDKELGRFAVKESYDVSKIPEDTWEKLNKENVEKALEKAKKGDSLLQILAPITRYGNAISREVFLKVGLDPNLKYDPGSEKMKEVIEKVDEIQGLYDEIWESISAKNCQGFVTYNLQKREDGVVYEMYKDFNPMQITDKGTETKVFPTFCEAVDEFFSKIESQKQEQKALNVEKQALKKLENVKKDQESRVEALEKAKLEREIMADRIIVNSELVERALLLIRTALANQYTWETISEMRKTAAEKGDPVAKSIVALNFDRNEFTMRLGDPYDPELKPVDVPIEISMNASKNAQRYFTDKKSAGEKVQKTLASSGQAIKNAQEKARTTMAQVRITTEIKKTRKVMWFEKFHWFVSSEGYIVVGGRDAQQNELLVKKYLRSGDVYVHADVRGASSVVIRNKAGGGDITPKTLTEAAQMAVCYSNAWEANVSAAAWWVRHDQVSRTAPTGEYLPSGSFMIRGKKNFMPPSQLVMGFGLLFKLDEESAERHQLDQEKLKAEEEKLEEPVVELEEEKELDEFPDVQVSIPIASEEVTFIDVGPKNVKKQAETREDVTQQYLEEQAKAEIGESARTQRRKMRKEKLAKQKYKDQTEEDRQIQMELLKSTGKKPEPVPEKKPEPPKQKFEKPQAELKSREPKPQPAEEEDEDEKEAAQDDSDAMLKSLTANPREDDILMYVVPVVAPYQTLNSYKYKVKVQPGTGKRGKAAKQAIELFSRGKNGPRDGVDQSPGFGRRDFQKSSTQNSCPCPELACQ
ncbi:unnamed protein product [Caenorhabditis auriculariae]|uniref:NFACT RNA-binding domain-containing protein n=1 Tax=Caenorhabditis auriculariae TaxID=2777116 RepID=A0A8S1HPL7_9PELO|nr:unnamed protein product [Caenorhabditis auriculariae]